MSNALENLVGQMGDDNLFDALTTGATTDPADNANVTANAPRVTETTAPAAYNNPGQTIEYEVVTDEEQKEQGRNRFEERVQTLANERNEFKGKLETTNNELEKLRMEIAQLKSTNGQTSQSPQANTHNPFEDDVELKSMISGNNATPDNILKVVNKIADRKIQASMNKFANETINLIEPLLITKQAQEDGVDARAVNDVFAQYPELKRITGGYEVAKKLALTGKEQRLQAGNQVSSRNVTSNGKVQVTNKQMEQLVQDAFEQEFGRGVTW